MCIPAFCTPPRCAAASSHRCTRSSSPGRDCRPAGHDEPTRDALEGAKRGVVFLPYARPFVAALTKTVFTWKGGVDRQAGQARDFILSSRAVVLPVAGLLQGYEPHRALAEEIFAVDQLLDCGEKKRERSRQHRENGDTCEEAMATH